MALTAANSKAISKMAKFWQTHNTTVVQPMTRLQKWWNTHQANPKTRRPGGM